MKVRVHKIEACGLRPDSSHLCVRDARSGHECWFDYPGANFTGEFVPLQDHQWSSPTRSILFWLPEESDNGRYSVWVKYEDIADKADWLINLMLADQARAAAAWLRENWEGVTSDLLPGELSALLALAAIPLSGVKQAAT